MHGPLYRAPSSWAIIGAIILGATLLFTRGPDWLLDLVRAVEMIMVAMILGITGAIGRRYFANFKADATSARLLPRHVVRLGAGTSLLALVIGTTSLVRLGEPFLAYLTPLAFPGLVILLSGLLDMVAWLPNRTAPPDNSRRRRVDDPGHNEGS